VCKLSKSLIAQRILLLLHV